MDMNIEVEEKELYPKVMIDLEEMILVIFHTDVCGTVLRGDNYYKFGEYYDDWIPDRFRDYSGEIKLDVKNGKKSNTKLTNGN